MDSRQDRGQVVIEYVLLLIVVVSIATALTVGLASRQQGSEGSLMKFWKGIIIAIGEDDAQSAN